MEEITADKIREVISTPDPVLEALSMMLKELSQDLVESLSLVLAVVGADVSEMPAEYLLQAVLVEADKVLKPVSRDNWIKIYDGYHQVKAVLDANPALREELNEKFQAVADETNKSVESLLDGNF